MANDINKEDPHYKGEYSCIYEVNRKFPTGGVAGDFVVIDGWAHYWNAVRGTWCVNAERDSYWDELITNIIEKFKLVRGATFMGVASLKTVPTKVIGAKMYYFATAAGTYKNFDNLVVPQGINVLYSENGSSWVNTTLLEVAQELGVSTNKVVSQKAVSDKLSDLNADLKKKANAEEVYGNIYTFTGEYTNLRSLLLSVPKDIKKKFLIVRYLDDTNIHNSIIRISDFNNDSEWADATGWEILPTENSDKELFNALINESAVYKKDLLPLCHTVKKEYTSSESVVNINLEICVLYANYLCGINKYLNNPKYKFKLILRCKNILGRFSVYSSNENYTTPLTTYQDYQFAEISFNTLDTFTCLCQISKKDKSKEASFEVVSFYLTNDDNNLSYKGYNTATLMFTPKRFCSVKHDGIINVAIPKGTDIAYRNGLSVYADDLSCIYSKNCVLRIVCDNKILEKLSFIEVAYGANYKKIADFKFSSVTRVSDSLYVVYLTLSKLYYDNFRYTNAKLYLVLGANSQYTTEEDLDFNLKFEALVEDESKEQDIKYSIDECRKNIGTYCSNIENIITETSNKSDNILFSNNTELGYYIQEGSNMLNEYLVWDIDIKQFSYKILAYPVTCSVNIITNKYSKNDFDVLAELYNEAGDIVDTLEPNYGEIYNGIIKIEFQITSLYRSVNKLQLKLTIKSDSTTGVSFSVYENKVNDLTVQDTIASRLYNLENSNEKNIAITSPSGYKFNISVDDEGNLKVTKLGSSKMLVMAHSWGKIPKNPSIGWYGDWSASASAESLDLTHQIASQIKTVKDGFEASLYRFAIFGTMFKDESSWATNAELNGMQELDFDSICICSFVASPPNKDWTGFGKALVKYINNIVLVKKDGTKRTGVQIYMIKQALSADIPDDEINYAVETLGINLIDDAELLTQKCGAFPWIMPNTDDGSPVTKGSNGEQGNSTTLSYGMVTHPGNYGYYRIAKQVKEAYCNANNIKNDDKEILEINKYAQQPSVTKYKDLTWSGWNI